MFLLLTTMANQAEVYGNTNKGVKEPTTEEKEFEEFLEYCTERVPCINHCYGISISQYTVDTQNGMCDDCFHKISNNSK